MEIARHLSPVRWLSSTLTVSRADYITTGITLMGVKYGLEGLIVYLFNHSFWSPWAFLSPFVIDRLDALQGGARASFASSTATPVAAQSAALDDPSALVLGIIAALSLPFLAIGLSMSTRRAADAGLSPWLGLAFAVPVLNYVTMFCLVAAPSRPEGGPRSAPSPSTDLQQGPARAAMVGVFAAVVLALSVVLVASDWLAFYGASIFFLLPLAMGAVVGFLVNRERDRGRKLTMLSALAAASVTAGALLLSALEGILCLAIAGPLALLVIQLGAALGRSIALMNRGGAGPSGGPAGPTLACIALLPLFAAVEDATRLPTVYEVSSHVDVRATPAEVWRYVVAFPDLPAPAEWYFKTGIAVPLRARIQGQGIGAVRHCEFSTGAFVEPITLWEPERRLAFDVASQPPPMEEWSPYRNLHPPHLAASIRSLRGEFRITPLGPKRTRLEGSTWYTLNLEPAPYFRLWSNAIIHRIHLRVLEHLASLAEGHRPMPIAASLGGERSSSHSRY